MRSRKTASRRLRISRWISSTNSARFWKNCCRRKSRPRFTPRCLPPVRNSIRPNVAELVLSQWAQFAPSERSQATDLLLRRGAWALALAQYLEKENVPITTLDPAHAAKLENYPSAKVREIVRKLRGQGPPEDRQKVFKEYREVISARGDAAEGKVVFEKNCASCHEIGGVGSAVGPNLAAMVNRGAESVLFNVLAPNVEVDPRFLEYVVLTGRWAGDHRRDRRRNVDGRHAPRRRQQDDDGAARRHRRHQQHGQVADAGGLRESHRQEIDGEFVDVSAAGGSGAGSGEMTSERRISSRLRISDCGLRIVLIRIRIRCFVLLLLRSLATCAVAVDLRVATFKVDVTPPPGSPLCDGLVPPATGVNDPLSARGIVLKADQQKPVVLVAVDWVGIGNEGHDAWRQAIAEACETLDRSRLRACASSARCAGLRFSGREDCRRGGTSRTSCFLSSIRARRFGAWRRRPQKRRARVEPVTHVGYGKGVVEKVASNRRILGPDGKVKFERMSAAQGPGRSGHCRRA